MYKLLATSILSASIFLSLFSCNAGSGSKNEMDSTNIQKAGKTLSTDAIKATQPLKVDSASNLCESSKNEARQDFKLDSLKYYLFGIAGPSKVLVTKLKKEHIRVVPLGCTLSNELLCYNQIADSIILVKFGVSISVLAQQKVM